VKKDGYFIGIDEVGRGSLAGPVTVAAVAYPKGMRLAADLGRLRDSKRLSAGKRKRWLQYIVRNPNIVYAIAHVQPSVIDEINIARATDRAATRALQKIFITHGLKPGACDVYLDGLLSVAKKSGVPRVGRMRAVIRGDEKYRCVMLASIAAKEIRDKLMRAKHRKYPQYGFRDHVGYGTEGHREALRKLGPAKPHRLTFIEKCASI
jgi:ribonuclease HII